MYLQGNPAAAPVKVIAANTPAVPTPPASSPAVPASQPAPTATPAPAPVPEAPPAAVVPPPAPAPAVLPQVASAAPPQPGAKASPPAAPPPQARPVAPPAPAIPPLPATPEKAIALLQNFGNAAFKAVLAQPGLRLRVETLMGLEGCNWSVSAAASREATTRQAATFINRMNDDDLRDALTSNVIQDRIDTAFGRGSCNVTRQTESTITNGFPDQNGNDQSYPGGLPGDLGTRGNGRRAPNVPVVPGNPYGYGGVVPGYIPR